MTKKSSPHTKRVLVVEDEKPMAHALELKLSHAGFAAQSAGDGEEGLMILKKQDVDLVILDLVMPKLDGFGVLEALKEQGVTLPVIVLSNLSQGEDEKRARLLGATEFFIKSNTSIAEIIERVKKILS